MKKEKKKKKEYEKLEVLPRAGQLWRVRSGLKNYYTHCELTRHTDATLPEGSFLMVVKDGEWRQVEREGNVRESDSVGWNGFIVSIMFGEKLYEDMVANAIWWAYWWELIPISEEELDGGAQKTVNDSL